MPEPTIVFVIAIVAATLITAVSDIRWNRIPNYFTVPIFAAALIYHGVTSGLSGLGMSLLGFALGMVLLLVPWLFGGGGAGDVKLMAAIGAWFGPKLVLCVWMASMAFALCMETAVLIYVAVTHGITAAKSRYLSQDQTSKSKQRSNIPPKPVRKRVVPYAVPVALGSWIVLVYLVLQNPIFAR